MPGPPIICQPRTWLAVCVGAVAATIVTLIVVAALPAHEGASTRFLIIVVAVVPWMLLGTAVSFASWTLYQYFYFAHVGVYDIALGEIAAYTQRYSFTAGDMVPLYLHTTADAVGHLYRLGRGREDCGVSVSVRRHLQCARYDRRTGFEWEPSLELQTQGLRPGVYALVLQQLEGNRVAFALPILIKPSRPAPIAVIASTNSWDAYNDFGGVSAYANRHINAAATRLIGTVTELRARPNQRPTLPYARPNVAVSGELVARTDPRGEHSSRLIAAEWSLLAFLEREGYDYGVYADADMAFAADPLHAQLIVIHGHAEYWSAEMVYKLERYIVAGGKVIVSGGNPLYRTVTFSESGLTVEPERPPQHLISGLIGSSYTSVGQHTAAPFRVNCADHWIFSNTGLNDGQIFGERSCFVPGVPNGGAGASGVFTQKVGPGSALFGVLATGLNAAGPAQMVYRDTEAGGWVFNSSSAAFTGAAGVDPIVDQMLRNLIDDAVGVRPRGIGAWPAASAAGPRR
jgi:N,N-dimethylformamidase beta subunit-like, C-terminal